VTIIEAMEENIAQLYRDLGASSPRLDAHDGPDAVWVLSDVPSPYINAVVRTRGTPRDVVEIVDAAIARGKVKGVPFLWWVVPDTSPPNLPAELVARGCTPVGDMPGMHADLRTFTRGSLPDGLTIERVTDASAETVWCDIVRESFALTPEVATYFHGLLRASGSSADARMQHFIGSLNGVPVATTSLLTGHDVAGIYCVATLASARRRGIGAAMMRNTMHVAKAAGASSATLQASPAGEPVYRDLGFVECCRVAHYLWKPDTSIGEAQARRTAT
jgi:ribosomal protein S18 acetylase RimI-like enzyme